MYPRIVELLNNTTIGLFSGSFESEEIDIDQITTMVKRANQLITFCQDKLRKIENELKSSSSEN